MLKVIVPLIKQAQNEGFYLKELCITKKHGGWIVFMGAEIPSVFEGMHYRVREEQNEVKICFDSLDLAILERIT